MSEQMSSAEIEDVLSSIRRLISEELRPGVTRPAAAPLQLAPSQLAPSQPAPGGADKLILTPALRVVHPAPEADPAITAEPEPPLATDPAAAEDEADAPPVAEARFWSETEEDADLSADDWAEPETVAFADFADPTPIRPMTPGFGRLILRPAEPPTARILPDILPTDTGAEDAGAGEEADIRTGEGGGTPLPSIRPSAADWAEIARARFLVSQVRGETASRPAIAPTGAIPASSAPEPAAAPATPPVDADSLRDLVRDLIRQELQGALGERMTRNIRKLVRSEIARALSAGDLPDLAPEDPSGRGPLPRDPG